MGDTSKRHDSVDLVVLIAFIPIFSMGYLYCLVSFPPFFGTTITDCCGIFGNFSQLSILILNGSYVYKSVPL